MPHDVLLEYDPATRHYTATVPGMPGILADARTEKTALKMAAEAIAAHRAAGRPVLAYRMVQVDA
ncbi:MAG: hypothetical protein QOD77_1315 [Thermoplasmata archaeon]|nr:hypothetical protein [Thermoplasmata archaeon]